MFFFFLGIKGCGNQGIVHILKWEMFTQWVLYMLIPVVSKLISLTAAAAPKTTNG